MWLSRRFKKFGSSFAETAVVTSANGGKTEATSDMCAKNISVYAPYGYSYAVPFGQEILLINGENGSKSAGIKMNTDDKLENGEIMIKSLGGASICLKNNGEVVINNSLTVAKNGVVINAYGEEIF